MTTTFVRGLLGATLLIISSACSRDPSTSVAPLGAPITPELSSQDPPRTQVESAHSLLNAELNAGGVPARYEAHFAAQQLTRIDEARARDGKTEAGVYEYYGARLLKYEGAGLTRAERVKLELDMQGRVTSARADFEPASAEEISAIRARAQLLRSHALAQRATRSHEGAQPETSPR